MLRPFSIYGYREAETRLIPTAIRAGLSGGTLPLTRRGYVRDYIFVEDVAEACLLAVETDGIEGEIINIATGIQTSNEEVVSMIGRQLGKEIKVEVGAYPPHPTDTSHWCADVSKAKRLLGWEARHTLDEGLSKTVAWFKENAQLRHDIR
jgi:nucleoside-diphosphate-sugar epimerase